MRDVPPRGGIGSLLVYAVVNGALAAIWAITNAHGFF
jgi:hypothetical protein